MRSQMASSVAINARPTHKAERTHVFAMDLSSKVLGQGSRRGHDSATGFPVRSHHLSGLSEGQRLRVNSFTVLTQLLHIEMRRSVKWLDRHVYGPCDDCIALFS